MIVQKNAEYGRRQMNVSLNSCGRNLDVISPLSERKTRSAAVY